MPSYVVVVPFWPGSMTTEGALLGIILDSA
jgi:hypothetical protein